MEKQDSQRRYVEHHLAPLLEAHGFGTPLVDYGCGRGGVVNALAAGRDGEFIGVDSNIDSIMVALDGAELFDSGVEFVVVGSDYNHFFAKMPHLRGTCRTVLLCDVVEHVGVWRALATAAALLAPGGLLYVSFPTWRGPYGGHQQTCRGIVRFMPWAHVLLPRLMSRLSLRTARNPEDIESVYTCGRWVTLRGFEEAALYVGFAEMYRQLWIVRPELMRHGMRPLAAPMLWPELLTTGVEYVLMKGD